jgi:hypothetical protein
MLNRSQRLSVQMLQRDKEALRHLARVEGEPISVIVRRLIRQALHEHGLSQPTQSRSMGDARVRREAHLTENGGCANEITGEHHLASP